MTHLTGMWVVLQEIFQSPDFTCDGVGGDYVLPGVRARYLSPFDRASSVSLTKSVARQCVQYQHLHQVRHAAAKYP